MYSIVLSVSIWVEVLQRKLLLRIDC